MTPRAMLAVEHATGRVSRPRQFKSDDPDRKGYPGLPGWGLDRKKILLQNLKEKKLDGYLSDMKKFTKVYAKKLGCRNWRTDREDGGSWRH